MSLPKLGPNGAKVLDDLLAETVARRHVPAVFYLATNAKETFYSNQKGEVVFGDTSSGQVNEDTIQELFSQTKFVTAIAALQCVDKGLVDLDSEADVEKYLPEFARLEVLKGYDDDGKAILGKAEKKTTLRQLLSHSAGCTYAHADTVLSPYFKTNPTISLFDPKATLDTISYPLIYEPGTSWCYSSSIDWAGKLVERASGQRLDHFFDEHIWKPIGATSMTFFPTAEVKKRKQAMTYRNAQGDPELTPTRFGMGRPTEEKDVATDLLLGGAGLFGTQKDYLKLLRAVLQADPNSAHKADKPIISAKSYAELWKGNVSEKGREQIVKMVARPAYVQPPATKDNVDYSVGFLLNKEDMTGRRKAISGCWSGAAKTQFWIDPVTGIAAIVATQLLSPSPDPWYASYVDYETALYANLA